MAFTPVSWQGNGMGCCHRNSIKTRLLVLYSCCGRAQCAVDIRAFPVRCGASEMEGV